MNRFVKGMIAGGLLGATVGAVMVLRSSYQTQEKIKARSRNAGYRARRTAETVANNAMRLGTTIRSNTSALARRMTGNRTQAET